MNAVILCAGKGERLRPFTYHTPKPLLEIIYKGQKKPIVHHIIDEIYKSQSIDEIFIVVDYLKEKISNYINSLPYTNITIIDQIPSPKGTSAAIYSISNWCDDDFFVINGDTITDSEDIEKICNHYNSCIAASTSNTPEKYGVINIKDGFVKSIEEKPQIPESNLISVGAYKFDTDIFDSIEQTELRNGELVEADAINIEIKTGKIFIPYILSKPFIHLSTTDDYKRYR